MRLRSIAPLVPIFTILAACSSGSSGVATETDGASPSPDGASNSPDAASDRTTPDDSSAATDANPGDTSVASPDAPMDAGASLDAPADVFEEGPPVAISCASTTTCQSAPTLGPITGDVFELPSGDASTTGDTEAWVVVDVQPYQGGNLILNGSMSLEMALSSPATALFMFDAYLPCSAGMQECTQVTVTSRVPSGPFSNATAHLQWPDQNGTDSERLVSIHVYPIASVATDAGLEPAAEAGVDGGIACYAGATWDLGLTGGD